MRRRFRVLGLATLVLLIIGTAVLAGTRQTEELKTARAEVGVVPSPAVPATSAPSGGQMNRWIDFQDSLALVLVGGMLLGLAAAVRRTV